MKPVDFLKALGVAILIMVLDMAAAFCTVFIWSLLNPEVQTLTMTDPKVIELSTISTRSAGPLLFALLIWIFQRKRPDRNSWAFALSVFGFYFLLDWSMVKFQGIFDPQALVIAALKFVGAMAGAWLAKRSY